MRQLQVQRKMLNSKDWTAALMVKSRQWRDPGKHRGPNYIPESLEAKLQATLIAATDRDLTAAMADGNVPKCVGVSTFIFFSREASVVGRPVIGLSSDELVSNSPGLYPSHDETFW
jgi:hypothetical protein